MDHLDKEKRSWNMSKIRSKNTKPELTIRSMLHKSGFRYRLHKRDLPGKPDIVLKKYNTVIFVHGCFWHQHKGCKRATLPKSNKDYWLPKLKKNKAKDKRYKFLLKKLGWKVITIWECETKNENKLRKMIIRELNNDI